MSSARSEDQTASARIRDAALNLFGANGVRATTVRAIARDAGVSAALVLHHYGSKDGLRQACDDYVIATIRDKKTKAFSGTALPQVMAYVDQHPEFAAIFDYLLRVVHEGGPTADAVFDRMIDAVSDYLAVGETHGMVRPTSDPQARAAILTGFSFGLLAVQHQVARRLGGAGLMEPSGPQP